MSQPEIQPVRSPMTITEWLEAQFRQFKEAGWLDEPRNKGTDLMLIVTEVSEAMKGERKNLMDTHLPHRKMAEVEMADVVLRVFSYCGTFGYDLEGAMIEKMEYNRTRPDHKKETRTKAF